MVAGLIRGGLKNRIIIVVIALGLALFGIRALKSLSVDAFPDVTKIGRAHV